MTLDIFIVFAVIRSFPRKDAQDTVRCKALLRWMQRDEL